MKLNFTKEDAILAKTAKHGAMQQFSEDWLTLHAEVERLQGMLKMYRPIDWQNALDEKDSKIKRLAQKLDEAYEFKRHNPLEEEVYKRDGEIERLREALGNIAKLGCEEKPWTKKECDVGVEANNCSPCYSKQALGDGKK